jgi:hypothetical protein
MTRRARAIRMTLAFAAIPAALLCARPAAGQTDPDRWLAECREADRGNRGEHHCEVRTFDLAATGSLDVDASPNGGITVTGWDRNQVQVVALVRANARTLADAEALAREVEVQAEPGSVHTEGPRTRGRTGWSVSYQIRVPNRTDLDAESTNGGIDVSDVGGEIRLQTTNGGISLESVYGDVRGQTVNGGVRVELEGDSWNGAGLDVQTTNGGVSLVVPEGYSADLTASTVNGGLDVDFPVTVQGRIGRRVDASLGRGGPPIRIQTTNGGVSLRRR